MLARVVAAVAASQLAAFGACVALGADGDAPHPAASHMLAAARGRASQWTFARADGGTEEQRVGRTSGDGSCRGGAG